MTDFFTLIVFFPFVMVTNTKLRHPRFSKTAITPFCFKRLKATRCHFSEEMIFFFRSKDVSVQRFTNATSQKPEQVRTSLICYFANSIIWESESLEWDGMGFLVGMCQTLGFIPTGGIPLVWTKARRSRLTAPLKFQNEKKLDHEREWDFCGGGDGQSQPDAGHAARCEFHIVLLSLSFQQTKNGI